MTFPVVSASADSGSLSGSSQTPTLAAHSAGDRILLIYAVDGGASNYVSHTAGWDLLANVSNGAVCFLLAFELKSAASSSESITVTLGGARTARAFSYTITGSDTATAVEVATATGISSGPNSPSVTPSWGAADTLWVTAFGQDNSTITLSSYPGSYTDNQLNYGAGTTSTPRVGGASQELNASSEDPGAFTLSASEQWTAITVAVKPAGGAATYTITPSGGVTFSGAIPLIRERLQPVSGQVTFGGTAPITFTGSATYTIVPSGGFVLSGAPVQIHERALVPSGGVVFSGSPAQIHEKVLVPSGQVTFGGSAPITFIPAGGVVSNPVSRVTVGSARSNRIS
jgi:hypothetical protein